MSIAVLMSTYNGELYIRQQIESILAQKKVSVQIIIRDDGSKDSTLKIIKQYERKHENIVVLSGKNVGVKKSFATLIRSAPDCDYYAFADQDDIWYDDKLFLAINALKSNDVEKPMLYFGNQNCVNKQGEFLYKRLPDSNLQPSVIHTLLKNEYSGCTMVFNKIQLKMMQKFYAYVGEDYEILHDVCSMLIAQLLGSTIYDKVPHMDFRRHEDNCTEARTYSDMKLTDKLIDIKRKTATIKKINLIKGRVRERCNYLLVCFGDEISSDDREKLVYFRDYSDSVFSWLRFLLHNKYQYCFPKPKWIVYFMIFFNIY